MLGHSEMHSEIGKIDAGFYEEPNQWVVYPEAQYKVQRTRFAIS